MPGTDSPIIPALVGNPFRKVRVRDLPIWVIGMIVLGMCLMAATLSLTRGEIRSSDFFLPVLYFAELGIIIWIVLQNRRAGIDLDHLIGSRPARFDYGRLAGVVVALLFFSLACMMLMAIPFTLLDIAPPWQEAVVEGGEDWSLGSLPLAHRIVMLLVLAPVIEEIVFRGYLLHRFSCKWNPRTAIWVSSALFALCHWDVIGTFVFALVGCCLYLRTRTLIVPMIMHAMYNSIPVILSLLGTLFLTGLRELGTAGPPEAPDPVAKAGALICLGVLITILLIVTLPRLIRFIRNNWPEPDRELPYFAPADETAREVIWNRWDMT